MILYQFISHLNNGPCVKENRPVSPEDEPGPSCSSVDPDFLELTLPHLISQSELNDLVRQLSLSKIQAEHLAPRLQGGNLLEQVVSVIEETLTITVFVSF